MHETYAVVHRHGEVETKRIIVIIIQSRLVFIAYITADSHRVRGLQTCMSNVGICGAPNGNEGREKRSFGQLYSLSTNNNA